MSPGPWAANDSALKRKGPVCRTLRINAFQVDCSDALELVGLTEGTCGH